MAVGSIFNYVPNQDVGYREQMTSLAPRFAFFFPFTPPSGVASIFAKLAEEIMGTGRGLCRIIDFQGGAMDRMAAVTGRVPCTTFTNESVVRIEPDEILVRQAEIPGKKRRQLLIDPATRMIEWQLHPHNLLPTIFPNAALREFCLRRPALYRRLLPVLAPRQKSATAEFVELAAQRGSLFFQDEPGLRATESFLDISVADPILVPLPVSVPERPWRNPRATHNELRVAWVGRLYDFKIHILVHTLRRFRLHAETTGRPVVFHVVGAGPKESLLEEFSSECRHLKLVRHGDMSVADLAVLLRNEIDLVASMGTAALEGAAAGLPVILLDVSYGPVPPSYQFRWLHNAQGLEVGHIITSADCCKLSDSLAPMLDELHRDYEGVARKSFDYVLRNHALQAVCSGFLARAGAASLRFGDVPARLWHKSLIRRSYERLRY